MLLLLFRSGGSGNNNLITSTAILQHPVDYVLAGDDDKTKKKPDMGKAYFTPKLMKSIFKE